MSVFKRRFQKILCGNVLKLPPVTGDNKSHIGCGGFSSRYRCLVDSMKKGHILYQTYNQDNHRRNMCRAGAGIDALTTSPVGLTVERGVDGAPVTLTLHNVTYFLLYALNQVDRASVTTTHGQWATTETVPDPVTSTSSAQVEERRRKHTDTG